MISRFAPQDLGIFGFTLHVPAFVFQLGLCVFFGLIVGLERELRGKPASLRTFTIISSASCLYTMLSIRAVENSGEMSHDVTRVAANIVSGVGFIGGGVIFKTTDRIEGVTTGALIWLMAAIGMACGFNAISEACWAFAILIVTHTLIALLYRIIYAFRTPEAVLEAERKRLSLED